MINMLCFLQHKGLNKRDQVPRKNIPCEFDFKHFSKKILKFNYNFNSIDLSFFGPL